MKAVLPGKALDHLYWTPSPGCPLLSGSFKNPLVFSKSGSYSTLTMTSSSLGYHLCVVLHGGDGVPKRSSDSLKVEVSGRGLAWVPTPPWDQDPS